MIRHDRYTHGPALLVIFASVMALALLLPGPKAGPKEPRVSNEITCISANVGGQEIHRDLLTAIPTNNSGQIRAAFVRWGQEMQFSGDEKQKVAGARMVQDFATAPEATSTYIVGAVCYVLRTYCDPSCFGNGCARARFYYN